MRGRVVARLLVPALGAAIALAGCSTDATMSDPPAVEGTEPNITPDTAIGPQEYASPGDYRGFFTGEVEVDAQTSDGTSVHIQEAGIDDMVAWVGIHRVGPPQARQLLGYERLPVAAHKDDFRVELDPALEPGEHMLRAVLYQDSQPVGSFNPQAGDNPVTTQGGDVIDRRFRVTVPGQTG